MMTNAELAAALRRIAPETGSLVCLGCGYEHNCGIHGCALLHEATERIKRMDEMISRASRASAQKTGSGV